MDPEQPNPEPLPEDNVANTSLSFRSLQFQLRAQSVAKQIRDYTGEDITSMIGLEI